MTTVLQLNTTVMLVLLLTKVLQKIQFTSLFINLTNHLLISNKLLK